MTDQLNVTSISLQVEQVDTDNLRRVSSIGAMIEQVDAVNWIRVSNVSIMVEHTNKPKRIYGPIAGVCL